MKFPWPATVRVRKRKKRFPPGIRTATAVVHILKGLRATHSCPALAYCLLLIRFEFYSGFVFLYACAWVDFASTICASYLLFFYRYQIRNCGKVNFITAPLRSRSLCNRIAKKKIKFTASTVFASTPWLRRGRWPRAMKNSQSGACYPLQWANFKITTTRTSN